jgi:ABC-type amino acid transport substrate-binding protein
MSMISRKGFLRVAGAGILSVAAFGVAGCGSSSSTDNSSNSTEEYPNGAKLLVGSDCAYAPHSWIQSDDSNGAIALDDGSGYVGGYDTQVAQMLADEYDWDVKFVKVDFDGLIPALTAGTIDCIIDGMGVTDERKQSVDFSDYYWTSDQGMVVLATSKYASATSLEDFSGAKIAAQTGSIWESMVEQIPGVDQQNSMADENTIIVAIQSGVIDGTIMGETEAKSAIMSNPDLAWVSFEDGKGFTVDEAECSAGIAVRKGDTELLDKINTVVDTLTHDEQQEMMQKAFDEQPLSVSSDS